MLTSSQVGWLANKVVAKRRTVNVRMLDIIEESAAVQRLACVKVLEEEAARLERVGMGAAFIHRAVELLSAVTELEWCVPHEGKPISAARCDAYGCWCMKP